MHDILPMSLDTLKALTWDLVCFAVPSSQIELVWKSVQARHRQSQLRPPLCEANQYASWVKMLGSVRGRPMALKLPIQKATVRWLLAWRPTTLAAHRARLLTVVATLACMWVNEVARLQVCNLWFDHLASYGVPGFEGMCSVHIDQRKNVTVRKGHYPALGRSKDPALDIVAQLRTLCPPLLPLTMFAQGGTTVVTDRPCSRDSVATEVAIAPGGTSSHVRLSRPLLP